MPDNLLLPGETGTLQLFKYVWGEVGRCKLYLIGTVPLVVSGWGGGSKEAASVGIWICFAAIPAVNCRRCATADGGVSDSRALE